MLDARHGLCLCGIAGPQLIGDYDPRRMALSLQQFAHQPPGSFRVAPTLYENVEHETILIDSAPEPVFLATDRNDDFVEVAFVAEPTSRTPADVVGEVPAEFPAQSRIVWRVTMIPRAASMSSTMRRMSGKRSEATQHGRSLQRENDGGGRVGHEN